jgi:predicted phosphodiesterase
MGGIQLRSNFLWSLGLVFAFHATAFAHPGEHGTKQAPWQQASDWPDRIVATVEGDPATSISVSWRTDASVVSTKAEIALARGDARFDREARAVEAETQLMDLTTIRAGNLSFEVTHNSGLPPTHHHSVRFDRLEPDTLYAYRVQGADRQWSEWFQTRTAPLSGPIRFIYFGDAQNGLASHWPRVIRAAFQEAPDARFILHAGDLVNRGSRDLEWAHWFRAGSFIHGVIPAIPVTGNHEYDDYELSADEEIELLSLLWRPQFRLPVEAQLSEALHETVYSVRYSADLEVFVLNTNIDDLSEQAEWLDAKLEESDVRWRVVSMHHPIFSSGRGRDSAGRRAVLLPILLKHKVDLVLQGHDHTYARGTLPSQDQVPSRTARTDGESVTSMFVNSVSGSKQYNFSEDGWDKYAATGVRLDRKAENTQFFQVIEIDEDALHYAAYSADGVLYDEFRLAKELGGSKKITNTEELPPERRFDNTLPYEDVQE